MFTIRPFDYSTADYEALEMIEKLVFDEFASPAQQWRHADERRSPKMVYQRDVIELDGVAVAIGDYGHFPWAYHPRKFRMMLLVHPEHDDPAIRPLYHKHVLQTAVPYDLVAIQAGMREDKTTDITFLRESGFVLVSRMPSSALDVPAFDPAVYDDLLQKVAGQGIAIKTLGELQATDPDWLPKLHDLDWAVEQDVPSLDPPRKKSTAEFIKERIDNPDLLPDGWFVAVDGERYVGLSRTWRRVGNPTHLRGGLTGVRREYRRRGIATALKVNLIRFAQEYGALTMHTANDEANPMFAINLKLGFALRPAWVEYEKVLQAGTSAAACCEGVSLSTD